MLEYENKVKYVVFARGIKGEFIEDRPTDMYSRMKQISQENDECTVSSFLWKDNHWAPSSILFGNNLSRATLK